MLRVRGCFLIGFAALGGPTAAGIGVACGDVTYFSDDFESYADDAAVAAAGWSIVAANTPVENANWTITNPCGRGNPPMRNGFPSAGKFMISDSDCADGSNVEGTGQSHDLWTPSFSTIGGQTVWLHVDCVAEVNDNADAIFDVDVSTNGGGTWVNVLRRVSPGAGRTFAPISDNSNADGFFGQLDLDISAAAANQADVKVRFRHTEPTDDWYIAIDNLKVDCFPPPSGGECTVFSEDFSSGLGGMTAVSGTGNSGTETWHTTDKGNRYVAGTVSRQGLNRINHPNPLKQFVIMDSDADPDPPEQEFLRTPALDLTDFTEVYLHFKSETVVDIQATQAVLLSLDGGGTIAQVLFKYNDTTGATGANAFFDTVAPPGSTSDGGEEPFYAERVLSVPAAAGQANVVFAFLYQSPGDRWWWALDDVQVTATGPGCTPSNDDCDGAIEVAVPSVTNGTTTGNDPDNVGACVANNSPAVWYKVMGNGAEITANLCGSAYDTRLSVFEGGCGGLTCIGENDDTGGTCGGGSRVIWSSNQGTEYLLRVFGFDTGEVGDFRLTVLDEAPVPDNDICNGALSLDLEAQNPAVVNGSTRSATVDGDAPACGGVPIRSPGVWYTVLGTGGDMGASTCNAANFDNVITVYSGSCEALVCVAQNDDADGCGSTSRVAWRSVFNERYYILVTGFDAYNPMTSGRYHVGDFTLSVSGQPRPCLEVTKCRPDQVQKTVALEWDSVAAGHTGFEVLRNGALAATLGPNVTSYTDTPALQPDCFAVLNYEVRATGLQFECSGTCRAILSPGRVCFADDFEDYSNDVDFELAGYFIIEENSPAEIGAAWTVTNPGGRANPPTFDGLPSTGKFAISDSDFSSGDDVVGSGMSHDLWSPDFSCAGKSAVWLHMDASVQLNNNGLVVFDVDVSVNGGVSWQNVYRRVAPCRLSGNPCGEGPAFGAVTPEANASNTDGFFGRLDIDLTPAAAGQSSVRFRLRQFEPQDDWWIAVDNVIVDDVPAKSGGSECLLGPEGFDDGIPADWTVRTLAMPPNPGPLRWTTADPCMRRSASFPTPGQQNVNRLNAPFAILDTDCNDDAPHPPQFELLITPPVDCSEMEAVFFHWKSEIVVDSPTVQAVGVSLDGGLNFLREPIFNYNAGGLMDPREEPFYAERVFPVPQAAGQASVAFVFIVGSAGHRFWWAVDDIKVSGDPTPPPGTLFIRGDVNGDGEICGTVTDIVYYANYCFVGSGPEPPCFAAADVNGDGEVCGTVTDIVYYANYCFVGSGPEPPDPFPACGLGNASDLILGCLGPPEGCQ